MAIRTLDTEHFSDVELSAKSIAERVRNLQGDLSGCKTVALADWVGQGRTGFEDLYLAIDMQMKDISDEFWNIYEALISAEEAYMEADQDIATQIESSK